MAIVRQIRPRRGGVGSAAFLQRTRGKTMRFSTRTIGSAGRFDCSTDDDVPDYDTLQSWSDDRVLQWIDGLFASDGSIENAHAVSAQNRITDV
jgi:hypothetical protein